MEGYKDFNEINWEQVISDVFGFLKDVILTLSSFIDGFKKTYAFEEEATEA